MSSVPDPKDGLDEVLGKLVFMRGANRPLGELTLDDVRTRADELRSTVGVGPMTRVAPIARGWAMLTIEMERAGAATVRDLPGETVLELRPKLWVTLL